MRSFLIFITVCFCAHLTTTATTLYKNRERVAEILEKMPEETKSYDKIIWGDRGFYYLIVVNDSNYTQYFAHPDRSISHLVIDCVKNITIKYEILNFSPYFDLGDTLINAQLNDSKVSINGFPAYISYIEGNTIVSDCAFQTISQWPIDGNLLMHLMLKTRHLIFSNYSELESLLFNNGYKWKAKTE